MPFFDVIKGSGGVCEILTYLVIRKSPVECPDEIISNAGFPLEFIPYLMRGWNDMFSQSVPSLSVIPAKAGIQELLDNLIIIDKQIDLLIPYNKKFIIH